MPAREERLAIRGGSPVRERPLLEGWPGGCMIGEEEEKAALEVVRSKSLFRFYGPNLLRKCEQFENEFAQCVGSKYALGVSSGTMGLIVALAALGIGPGDEVLLPAYNFIACPSAILQRGAMPVFVEVDETLNMDPIDLEKRVTKWTRAIMPVHMRGVSSEMDKIVEVAKKHNIPVIEDCSQTIGASYKNRNVGTFGDIAVFSLQYHKIITTGEGGVIATSKSSLFERCVRYHDGGVLRRKIPGVKEDSSKMIIGIDCRMSELTAAVGIAQLHKMEKVIRIMREKKKEIKERISDIDEISFRKILYEESDVGVCLILFLPTSELAGEFSQALKGENINVELIYEDGRPLHDLYTQHVYANYKQIMEKRTASEVRVPWDYYKGQAELREGIFPRTDSLLKRALHLDINPLFSKRDIEDIINGFHKVAKVLL